MDRISCAPSCREYSDTKKFSECEITSSSCWSCQDRTSDWNWSIQICRNFGDWSTITVITTRKCEAFGANITRNWTTRTTIHSYRDCPPKFWSRVTTAGRKLRATSKIWRCAKSKAYINWFLSASLEIDPGNSVNQKGLWIWKYLQALHEDSTTWRLSWSWWSSTMGSLATLAQEPPLVRTCAVFFPFTLQVL